MKKYLFSILLVLAVSLACMKDYSNPLLSNLQETTGTLLPDQSLVIQHQDLPEVQLSFPSGSVTTPVEYSLSPLSRIGFLPEGPGVPFGPFISLKLETESPLLKPFSIQIELLTSAQSDSFFVGNYHNGLWQILESEYDATSNQLLASASSGGYIGVFKGTSENLLSLTCQPDILYYNSNVNTFYSPLTASASGNLPGTVHAGISFLWSDQLSEAEKTALYELASAHQPATYPLVSVDHIDSLLTKITYRTYSADSHNDFYLKKSILNQIYQLKAFTQVTAQFTTVLSSNIRVNSYPITVPVLSGEAPNDATPVLIPEGPYLSGQAPAESRVVAAFYIDKFEVTTQEYVNFLNAIEQIANITYFENEKLVKNSDKVYVLVDPALNGLSRIEAGYAADVDFAQRPVTAVTWYGAHAYAQYYSKRLPTSQEWEKAARGMDGNSYPWGNESPSASLCNWGENDVATAGGAYSPQGDSPYGIADMAGNVIEWCSDTYSGSDDKILHGGFWNSHADSGGVLSSHQWHFSPDSIFIGSGFRCAQDFQN